ncbi:MAG TPA: hypothetical protein VFA20_01390 [Myxococcaceae bacterium]|nr:hypothetical protein [Myxococcaceae bacterium]
MSRRLAVRLPLLFAVALGAWLWRSDAFSQPRELVVLLPSPAARVDVQLYSEGGELLAREERAFPPGDAASVVRMEISLRRGRYLVRAFLRGESGAERALSREVEISSERVNEVELKP